MAGGVDPGYLQFVTAVEALQLTDFWHTVGVRLKLMKCIAAFNNTQGRAQDMYIKQLLLTKYIDTDDIASVNIAGQELWNSSDARQDEWWSLHGEKMFQRWLPLLRADVVETGVSSSKIAAQQMLNTGECVKVHRSASWQRVKARLDANDPSGAMREANGAGDIGTLIMRAKLRAPDAKGAATSDQEERSEIDKRVFEWVQMEDAIIERKLRATYVNRRTFAVGMATSVREALVSFEDVSAGIRAAMVIITESKKLDQVSSVVFSRALRTVIEIYREIIGFLIGNDAAAKIDGMIDQWASKDQTFSMWNSVPAYNADTPCVFSMYRRIVEVPLQNWFQRYWDWLRGVSELPETLAHDLDHSFLRASDDTYAAYVANVAQLPSVSATGAVLPAAGQLPPLSCPICTQLNVPFQLRAHIAEQCPNLQSISGGKSGRQNRGARGARGGRGGQGGGGKGKSGGKGVQKKKKGKGRGGNSANDGQRLCYTCGLPGHEARNCPGAPG
jgi:uncharacterized membrane protein YgcG